MDSSPYLSRVKIANYLKLLVKTLNGIVTKQDSFGQPQIIKNAKKGKYENIVEKLLIWFKQARFLNILINKTVQEKKKRLKKLIK